MIITTFIVVAFAISEESKYTGVIVITSVIAVTVCIVFLLKSLLNMFDYKDERIQRDKRLIIINNPNRLTIDQIYSVVKNWDTQVGKPNLIKCDWYASRLPRSNKDRYKAICYGPCFKNDSFFGSHRLILVWESDDLTKICVELNYIGHKGYHAIRYIDKQGPQTTSWGNIDLELFRNEFVNRLKETINTGVN